MWSIITSPNNQVKLHLFKFLKEKLESLQWQVAIVKASPVSSRLFDILLDF